jgi:hypothetical protein
MRRNGVMECWSNGVMGRQKEESERMGFNDFCFGQYSSIPLLQYSSTPIF